VTDPQYIPATAICTKCRRELPAAAFSPRADSRTGLERMCRSCRYIHHLHTPDQMEKSRQRAKAYYQAHKKPRRSVVPEHVRARKRLHRAIERGDIARPSSCSECGVACKPEAHHEDYSRPLDVAWLCALCHGKRRWKYDTSPTALQVETEYCANGHERTPENTKSRLYRGRTMRECRECSRLREARRPPRKR
jgi:hypothetical protein